MQVFRSFTDTILGVIRGTIPIADVESPEALFLFNCSIGHVLPELIDPTKADYIGYEASWAEEQSRKSYGDGDEYGLIRIDSLTHAGAVWRFKETMSRAFDHGRLYTNSRHEVSVTRSLMKYREHEDASL